jgi:hypothetical protein
MFLNSLSGRFLILTAAFVMLAEVLIFVPSVARFREDYLAARLERAQIASLTLLADDMISAELEAELLLNAEVYNVVLRRDEVRELVLSSPMPEDMPWAVSGSFDLRDATAWALMRDAMVQLWEAENRLIRVIGMPVRDGGLVIEVTMETGALRMAMLDYGRRILMLSAVISVITAGLLFLAVRSLIVRPVRGMVEHLATLPRRPKTPRASSDRNRACLNCARPRRRCRIWKPSLQAR